MKDFPKKSAIASLIVISAFIGFLAFTLERSELNEFQKIEIKNNIYLDANKYLEFANLKDFKEQTNLSISLIQDRIEKHPLVENSDVIILERGMVEVSIQEKKLDAILFSNNNRYLISNSGEVLPAFSSIRNIDLPIIVNRSIDKAERFEDASKNKSLRKALNIISAAQIYDENLCREISEIDITEANKIVVRIMNLPFPIYFGNDDEIEKTVYLANMIKHLEHNELSKYVNYVDLKYNDLVYLGINEKIMPKKEKI